MSEALTPIVMVAGVAALYRVVLLCTDEGCPIYVSVPAVIGTFASIYWLMRWVIG